MTRGTQIQVHTDKQVLQNLCGLRTPKLKITQDLGVALPGMALYGDAHGIILC